MGERKPSGVQRPSGLVILDRYERVTGERRLLRGDELLGITAISVGGDYRDEALVYETDGARERSTPFGQYNPATQQWQFPAEYVRPHEQAAMRRFITSRAREALPRANAATMDAGHPLVDVYHPYTHKVRARLAQLLKPLGNIAARPAVRAALSKPESPVLGVDAYTQIVPTMPTSLEPAQFVERVGANDSITSPGLVLGPDNNLLSLGMMGLKVQNPGHPRGRSVRVSRHWVVASRTSSDPAAEWMPETDVLDMPRDWPVILDVAHALQEAHATNPNFSLLHAAVTYGDEYARARVGQSA